MTYNTGRNIQAAPPLICTIKKYTSKYFLSFETVFYDKARLAVSKVLKLSRFEMDERWCSSIIFWKRLQNMRAVSRIPFLIGKCFIIKLTFIVNIKAIIKREVKFCHLKLWNVTAAHQFWFEMIQQILLYTMVMFLMTRVTILLWLWRIVGAHSIIFVALLWLQQSTARSRFE